MGRDADAAFESRCEVTFASMSPCELAVAIALDAPGEASAYAASRLRPASRAGGLLGRSGRCQRKKRWSVAAAAATRVTAGAGSTAGAIPEHVHYLVVYLEFTGVFTPEGGGEPEFESEQKFYGDRGNLVHPEAIRCEVHFDETIPGEGTFEADGHVIAIPVN